METGYMTDKWGINRIGLINFWYYDEEEFNSAAADSASRFEWFGEIGHHAEFHTVVAGRQ